MSIRDAKNAFIAGKLSALAVQGLTSHEAAKLLDISYGSLRVQANKHNIKFAKKPRLKNSAEHEIRADEMAKRYQSGETLQEIARDYSLTRERVRQILALTKGFDATDGGQFITTISRKREISKRREASAMARWGCSDAQYRSLVAFGKEMRAQGYSREKTPTGAFIIQKRNAFTRGIEWRLTLWEWWTIWQESGRWDDRGRGHGYMMCRKGDVGPYAIDNVIIAPGHFNTSSSPHKKSGLPTGVSVKRDRFVAIICVGGLKRHLGVFATAEQAHAAYLTALAEATKERAA